jgi:hypothetical protein
VARCVWSVHDTDILGLPEADRYESMTPNGTFLNNMCSSPEELESEHYKLNFDDIVVSQIHGASSPT